MKAINKDEITQEMEKTKPRHLRTLYDLEPVGRKKLRLINERRRC